MISDVRFALLAALVLLPSLAPAVEVVKLPPRENFEVEGHTATLYTAPKPAVGKPWVWFAPVINGMGFAGRRMYCEGLMKAGISLAGYDLGEVRGAPGSSAQFTKFYEEMVRRGFNAKPVLLGQSRGGLMMLAWGFRNPEKVRAFVGIYPVCNLADYPMKNKPVTLTDYGMTDEELQRDLKRYNPIDNLQPLLDHKVPMFVIHGDSDKLVPYDLNTRLLKERYEAGGGQITVKVVPGEGHAATASFFEDAEVLGFLVKVGGGGE